MQISKRSKAQDRLSELPDTVIFHIFWFVPMRDVVRTTILSKRWRNLWTTTPYLNFIDRISSFDDTVHFRNFVNWALLHWNGVRILKFKVDYLNFEAHDSIHRDTDLWVNFAKEKDVEELYLHIANEETYWLPQCLYSCSSLKELSLESCSFRINGNVQWNQLKSLTITECFEVTEHVINQILSGSPRLGVLNMSFVDRGGNLIFQSNSLKELSICKTLWSSDDLSSVLDSELRIWTPNLETLKIEGFPYGNCRLMNVSSLCHATLGFAGSIYMEAGGCEFEVNDLENGGLMSSIDYIGEKFSQILQTIQHAESVTLLFCCIKVLGAMNKRCNYSSFPNVKSLKIGWCFNNHGQLVGFLDMFPQLSNLVLLRNRKCQYQDDPEALKVEANLHKFFLQQLRTVDVTWLVGQDSIFPLIEILLKYASKLENVVFRVDGVLTRMSLLLTANKLLKMPRSSSNCTIDFL